VRAKIWPVGVVPHDELVDHVIEWVEDIVGVERESIGSRNLIVTAPPRWGRTAVLDRTAAILEDRITETGFPVDVLRIDGNVGLVGVGAQAVELTRVIGRASPAQKAAGVLVGETGRERIARALDVTDVTQVVGGRGWAVANLVAGIVLSYRRREAANELDALERACRRSARRTAVDRTTVVLIDDIDALDPRAVDRILRGLVEHPHGRVCTIAAADPDGPTVAWAREKRYGLIDTRTRLLSRSTTMDVDERLALAAALLPDWSTDACRRLADRTGTFADILEAAAADFAEDVPTAADPIAAVDRLVAWLHPPIAAQAAVVAWLGGIAHRTVYEAALAAAALTPDPAGEPQVVEYDGIVRLADPAIQPDAVTIAGMLLAAATRRRMTDAVATTAGQTASIPDLDPIALLAALEPMRVLIDRGDLPITGNSLELYARLAVGRLAVGDTGLAHTYARTVLDQAGGTQLPVPTAALQVLAATDGYGGDPVPLPPGAVSGLEAEVWHMCWLLTHPHTSTTAIDDLPSVAARLDAGDPHHARWLRMLAWRIARSGRPTIATGLLQPLLTRDPPDPAATSLIDAIGPTGELHLQRVDLEHWLADLDADTPPDLDAIEGVLNTLAVVYHDLGKFRHALDAGRRLQPLSAVSLGADHPHVLRVRRRVAVLTGHTGDRVEALRLLRDLLPDQIRVLGAEHPDVLYTRFEVAEWTGHTGDRVEALRLLRDLLPDQIRVHGPDHPRVLYTRGHVAVLTGHTGDPVEALRLLRDLRPDQIRVLGADDPDVLYSRHEVARFTSETENEAEALRLFRDLLPDRVRVLGAEHPNVLHTRHEVATLTGRTGDPAEALHLHRDLLPDQLRVLGPDHPNVLHTRHEVATLTGRTGDPAEALHLHRDLLPDQLRVHGPDHPNVLHTRHEVAALTGRTGDPAEALHLHRDLLPDQLRVHGPDHPTVLSTRQHIAHWTGTTGDPAEALHLFRDLLPDQLRVHGPDHPNVLHTRHEVAALTGLTGDPAEALHLFRDLLPDQLRVHGPDHPNVLSTRQHIAHWTGHTGNAAEGT
jgi:hypothetical protein